VVADLDLDVARALHKPLNQDAVIAEA